MLLPTCGMYHSPFIYLNFKILQHAESMDCVNIMVYVYISSLMCRCPFTGETDRATLLRVGEGTLNWDSPDIMNRSPEAKNFLHMVLQPDVEYGSSFIYATHSHNPLQVSFHM